MCDSGASFPDILAQVPILLQFLLNGCEFNFGGRNARIRDLRLICRDTSLTALREATGCCVQLGDGAMPNPAQVVRLFQYSKLQHLRVTIITSSARAGPLLAQQLEDCTSQAAQLVQGLGAAMRSTTALSVIVEHNLIRSKRSHGAIMHSLFEDQSCPPSFSAVSRAVCTALARAMPVLKSMYLDGCCRDAAFDVFGSSCPNLTLLAVTAPTVPLKALKDIGMHLPSLHCFTLRSYHAIGDDQGAALMASQLSDYVGGSLLALKSSASLRSLVLDFNEGELVRCIPRHWCNVPAGLEELASNRVLDLQEAPELLRNLRSLTLEGGHHLDLLEIIQTAPQLQVLFALGSEDVVLRCDQAGVAAGIASLKQRMSEGLDVVVYTLTLEGSPASVGAALASLPKLCSNSLKLKLQGQAFPEQDCLEHVARVFPRLHTLVLTSQFVGQGAQASDIGLLEPLLDCAFLTKLRLHMQLALTTEELAWLFEAIGPLEVLGYVKNEGADPEGVRQILHALGISGEIEEYPHAG